MGILLPRLHRFQIDRPILPYALALLLTVLCQGLTILIHHSSELITFQLAVVGVVLSSFYGGLGPGLMSAILLSIGQAYFLLEPRYSLLVSSMEDALALGVFVLVSVLMSVLSEARLKAEAALRERTAELEVANRELEAFSYSVSHDLRSPLRLIDNHVRVGLQSSPSGTHAESLHAIRKTAQEMGELVDDLLSFSRLGRQPLNKRQTDLAPLVHLVLQDLRDEQEGRSMEISVGELPACEADPHLLKIVFANLLHNALKFTRKREVARIEVGSHNHDGGPVYYVKDNGIGFNMNFTQQLFGIFQRLHRDEHFEGTGLGLAIAQRIIQRHGGKIWAEAELDKGAVFYFTLKEEVNQ